MAYIVKTFFVSHTYDTKEEVVNHYWGSFYYLWLYGDDSYIKDLRILNDFDHQPVNINHFFDTFNRIWKNRRSKWRKKKFVFRSGPVEGIHKRIPYNNWMRYPRTKQERTQGVSRAKRSNLPTSWDDLYRKTERNWKSQRKTQYKPVAVCTKSV